MLAKRSLTVLKQGLEDRLYSGVAYALVSKRASGGVGTLGRLSFDEECDRVNRDTLFDVASLTKPLVTAMAVLQLVDRGGLSLDDSACELLDVGRQIEGVTVHHLLTHTSGLPAIPAGTGDAALSSPLETAPGEKYLYSDTGYILLGEIVRRVAGKGLDAWYKDEIAPKLYLGESGFKPDLSLPIVATSADEALDGLPHDPRARSMDGVAGHAGLFSSINDIAGYARALLGSGKALLSEPLFARLFENELDPAVGAQSLAFFCRGNSYLPDVEGFSDQSVGHSGFTGCFVLIDRASEAAACLLTNRVLNTTEDANRFLELRRRWLGAAAQDLGLAAPSPAPAASV
jgi:CubicO group peptidase (beta-lactamase class C family)